MQSGACGRVVWREGLAFARAAVKGRFDLFWVRVLAWHSNGPARLEIALRNTLYRS